MESIIKKLRAGAGNQVRLANFDPGYSGEYEKQTAVQMLDDLKEKMTELHEKLYADGNHSLLLIFQAMDAAGKDSVIKHVMSGLNPQGCQVTSFKQPSEEEKKHDFLWRHSKALPEKGKIGIHNRSHYENVLVCRVHPEILQPGDKAGDKLWKDRYQSINDFEKHLSKNGTVILKFFLHVSKEEQRERFLERLNDPAKNWKFAAGDLAERKLWEEYMTAYSQAIEATSTKYAPWFIIPADKKWFTRIAVAEIVADTLEDLVKKRRAQEGLPAEDVNRFKELLSTE